jgi:hypothetical protein
MLSVILLGDVAVTVVTKNGGEVVSETINELSNRWMFVVLFALVCLLVGFALAYIVLLFYVELKKLRTPVQASAARPQEDDLFDRSPRARAEGEPEQPDQPEQPDGLVHSEPRRDSFTFPAIAGGFVVADEPDTGVMPCDSASSGVVTETPREAAVSGCRALYRRAVRFDWPVRLLIVIVLVAVFLYLAFVGIPSSWIVPQRLTLLDGLTSYCVLTWVQNNSSTIIAVLSTWTAFLFGRQVRWSEDRASPARETAPTQATNSLPPPGCVDN